MGHTQNYIIRTQTVYDLVLKLIDAVFHLQNSDTQCRHLTITQNVKVKQTEVPNMLKPIRKKLREFEQARHTVIHHGAHQDDELSPLELFTTLEGIYRRSGETLPADLSFMPELRIEMTRELIKKRKDQYARFNSCILELISDVLEVLHKQFEKEERHLRVLVLP